MDYFIFQRNDDLEYGTHNSHDQKQQVNTIFIPYYCKISFVVRHLIKTF